MPSKKKLNQIVYMHTQLKNKTALVTSTGHNGMNTSLNEPVTIEEHQQRPALQKTSEPPDAPGLHQSRPEAGADEVSFVKLYRRPLMTIGLLAGGLMIALIAGRYSKPAVRD